MNVVLSIEWTFDHNQYFQGRSATHTSYDEVVTGCGVTLKEAINDALEEICNVDETVGTLVCTSHALLEQLKSMVKAKDFAYAYNTEREHNAELSRLNIEDNQHYFYASIFYRIEDGNDSDTQRRIDMINKILSRGK